MGILSLKTSLQTTWRKPCLFVLPLLLAGLFPGSACAQSYTASSQFFCYIAQYFKYIVGTAALVAILFWAIEHIFGVSRIHDIVIRVGVACAFVIAGATIITNSGLTVNCVIV